MSFNFQFISKETGQAIPLVEIDERMCKDLGIRCDAKEWSYVFQWCQLNGCIPMIQGPSEIDRDKLIAFLNEQGENHCITNMEAKVILKYLSDDYKFQCWYSR